MNIVTSRLLLRPFAKQDIFDVFEYCSQKGLGEMAGWRVHKSVMQTERVLSDWIMQGHKLAEQWRDNMSKTQNLIQADIG